MDMKRISMVSGAALLALTATASAGPMSIASSQVITPQIQIEPARYYYRHHYWHYGWHRGWHYGWYRHRYRYGWRHHRYYYGWNPAAAVVGGALGLATLPFAVATGWPYYGYYRPYYGYYGPYYY
jgi:hypothetical protein